MTAAADVRRTPEGRVVAQKEFVASLDEALAKPPDIPPRAMIPCDGDAPADLIEEGKRPVTLIVDS